MYTEEVIEQRVEEISKLYRTILGREPDKPGLKGYVESSLTIDEVAKDLQKSPEYIKKVRSDAFIEYVHDSNSAELLMLGSTPTEKAHIEELKKVGVEAVLDLNLVPSKLFKSEWKGPYKHIALGRQSAITIEKATEFLKSMFYFLFSEQKKVFVHSELGMSRAPLAVALFLVADRGMSFYEAVKVVVHKHKFVNPNKNAVTADLLEFVRSFKEKVDITEEQPMVSVGKAAMPDKMVQVADSLYITSNVNVGEWVSGGISAVFDISSNGVIDSDSVPINVVKLSMSKGSIDTFMPALIKSTAKRASIHKVCVFSDDIGMLMFYVENLYKSKVKLDGMRSLSSVRMSIIKE